MNEVKESSFGEDPEMILFVTDEEDLAIGAAEQQGLGEALGRAFTRPKEAVKADFTKTFTQMQSLLGDVPAAAHGYAASEITFELAFTAKGRVAFVAEAGMTTSISVTFKRK